MTIALIVLAFVAMPLVVFRGRTLLRYFAFELASDAFAFVLWRLFKPQDAYFAAIAFAVLKLAAFSIALARADDVKWSATRAAILAAIVYALVIPTQMRTPIDGDEPFYLLVTESIVHDRDLDLRNQYAALAHSATGRPDLKPQQGDPVGPHGEQYSRHEPFLPLLLVPGYCAAGLPGALATIALFGVLLVRSTVRLLEDEGVDDATIRALVPFFAFAPPIIYYAARIWPEVPGALFFVEALRGVRQRRAQRWLPALATLVLLKLRFGLIAVVLLSVVVWRRRSRLAVALAMIALPIAIVFAISGHLLNVHSWRELLPIAPRNYAVGLFGLLLDGAAGLLFQAPFYLLGVFAITRWKSAPPALRIGCAAALPYIVSLVPRSEWHGGWSPPLRYVVVFMPLLLLGAATLWHRAQGFAAPAALWSIGLTVHALVFPWKLFHIENGENNVGEWLSTQSLSDFSRLFPSFIRLNNAALVASVALVVVFLVLRFVRVPPQLIAPLIAVALVFGFDEGRKPARTIEFEDAHVIHEGGELYPEVYTVARFLYRGGWMLHDGDSVSFLVRGGRSILHYACATPVTLDVDGRRIVVPPTGAKFGEAAIDVARTGRSTIRCVSGTIDLDRLDHEHE
jgi:hypothetical protein